MKPFNFRSVLNLRSTLAGSLLIGIALSAQAQSDYPNLEAACANNPEKCEQVRAKIEEKCKADPAGCAEKKARLDQKLGELKAKCDANPQACEEKKEKMRERAEKFKAECAADPQACAAKKEKMRERMQQRMQNKTN